jgi:hypothetical protein
VIVATNTKRIRDNRKLVDRRKELTLEEGVIVLKKMKPAKFNETVEVSIRLGVDPKKADQVVMTMGLDPREVHYVDSLLAAPIQLSQAAAISLEVIRTVPASAQVAVASARPSSTAPDSICRADSTIARPAAVGSTPRPVRSKSAAPNWDSSSAIWRRWRIGMTRTSWPRALTSTSPSSPRARPRSSWP